MRIAWTVVNLLLGVLPALAFFLWVAQGCSLPLVAGKLGWPWICLDGPCLANVMAVDACLFWTFGFCHSALARNWRARWSRSAYMIFCGSSLALFMSCWQPLNWMAWSVPWPEAHRQAVSVWLTFLPFLGLIILASNHGFLSFIGLKQLWSKESPAPSLCTTGIYGVVRHPMHVVITLSLALALDMTLDRLVLLCSAVAYLVVAVPIEEAKLVRLYGEAYREYQRRTPALIPRFWRSA